jgi:uncharacterized protein
MAEWLDPRVSQTQTGATIDGRTIETVAVDQGLRAHMLKVYNYMASGVLLTGIVAMLFAPYALDTFISESGRGLSALGWLVMLAPLGFIMVMSFGVNKLSTTALQGVFWAFAAVMGLSLSTAFAVYTGESIARTFFITAASFAGLSLFGYTTKKDLSGWGSFLIMGVVGLFLASVVNIFLGSSTLQLVVSFLGVLIFAGLTAYDTQRIKSEYLYYAGHESLGKLAIMGALSLYLDFINMFQFLLSFLGNRE